MIVRGFVLISVSLKDLCNFVCDIFHDPVRHFDCCLLL